MQKYADVVLDRKGNVVPGASVRVKTSAGEDAVLYAANGTSQISNPLTTDNLGRFAFYAANGRYNLQVYLGSALFTVSNDILLEDPLDETPEVIKNGLIKDSALTNVTIDGAPAVNKTVTDALDERLDEIESTGPGGLAGRVTALEQFDEDLADQGGAGMVGWERSPLAAAIDTASAMLNAQAVNVWEFAALATGYGVGAPDTWDWTPAIQSAVDSFGSPQIAPPMEGGGLVIIPPMPGGGSYKHTTINMPSRVGLRGHGWASILENTGTGDSLSFIGTVEIRNVDQAVTDIRVKGNALSRHGIYLERTASRGTGGTGAGTAPGVGVSSVVSVISCKIDGHGGNGVRYGKDATIGSGNKLVVFGCYIGDNLLSGVQVIGQSNVASISNNSIVYNGEDGVNFNQVSSTCTVTQNFIADNTRYGVHAFRAEQPMLTHNEFNRNTQGAVVFNGDASGSIKYTEAGLIFANLFGDNGKAAANPREVQIRASRGTNILCNYFYATGTDTMIYLNDNAEGVNIQGNHFKDLTTEVKLEVKVGGINIFYTFDDDVDASTLRQIQSSYVTQHIIGANTTLFRFRTAVADSSPRFLLRGDGRMEWASGAVASDVSIERVNAGALRVNASVEMNRCDLAEGLSAPSTKTGYGRFYVEGSGATAALKARFSNGAVKIIAVKVAVPSTTTSIGQPGDFAVDASFRYDYIGDGTTHSWVRVAVAAW